MEEYNREITMKEGPFVRNAFPNGKETENVLSREITTTYIEDGYLCKQTVLREYRDGDYHDTSSSKRIVKVNV